MNPVQNVSLRSYSTMRLGGTAAYLTEVRSRPELADAIAWAQQQNLPMIICGSGSNIVWRDDGFPGLVLVNKIPGFQITADGDASVCTVGAGELWDSVVARTVQAGLSGIEALSLIPGTAGATPIQNVGAYGQEISNTLVSVEAYDLQTHSFITIPATDCGLDYRTSRFKTIDKGRFFITSITLRLHKINPQPPFYASLQQYLDQQDIHEFTPATIRDAVIAIRNQRLPDPALVANNGSFFANPIVDRAKKEELLAVYPTMPNWEAPDGRSKLAAAWLVDQAGFKDFHDPETGMATWHAQALVLINEHANSTADLLKFRQKIIDKVHDTFGVTLEQEPELLP